ncbi:MAG TPA: class I SAM-dependent methyltransferase [Acidimicrobiia bacterium]|jgi:SAM-dependent methyltransferase
MHSLTAPDTSIPGELPAYEVIRACRSCGASDLREVLSLGKVPLADALLTVEMLSETEPLYPLTLVFCEACSLIQTRETVSRSILFGSDYPYFSSYSDSLLEHSRRNVTGLIERLDLGPSNLVIEVASNDGYLLQYFVEAGVGVLGVDPAPGPASAAQARGIPTICDFFDMELAMELKVEGTRPDVIIGNNVLAHVPDQRGFVAAVEVLLGDGGVVVIEVPYLKDLIDRIEVDTIYHEHHCYFTATSLTRLFAPHGLRLVDIQHHPIHGGTLRAFFAREGNASSTVASLLAKESAAGLDRYDYYAGFAFSFERLRAQLRDLTETLITSGASIAAYGAAAKGAMLLNHAGLDRRHIRYVADRNPAKQGRYLPGVHIPIVSPRQVVEDPPDYLLVLPWNIKDEIIEQHRDFAQGGGRFIVPIPNPVIV